EERTPRLAVCDREWGSTEQHMKSRLLLAAAFSLATGVALAQTATFTLAPADQTKFTTWVTEQKVVEVPAPSGFMLQVGSVVPQNVTLYEIPASVGVTTVTKYRYVRMG